MESDVISIDFEHKYLILGLSSALMNMSTSAGSRSTNKKIWLTYKKSTIFLQYIAIHLFL